MFDLEKFRSFYYIVSEGSIDKAAITLKKHHSTISKHILDIEKYLNIELFLKKKRLLVLTPQGKNLYSLLQNHIPNLEIGPAQFGNPKTQSKNLRIITTTGLMGVWIVEKIQQLESEIDGLKIKLITTNDDVDFNETKADIGILPYQKADGLTQRKIKTFHGGLFASAEYLEKNGEPQTLDDLKNHKVIGFYADNKGHIGNLDWHFKKGTEDHEVRDGFLMVNSGFLIFEAGRMGIGVVPLIQEFKYLENSNLKQVLAHEEAPLFDIYFITRNHEIQSDVQKRFFELLVSN